MKGRVIISLIVVLTAVFTFSAYAADYPTKPITLIVAYPAGGDTDVGARVLASIAEKELGQPIVVVNRGTAGGQGGWTELARQKPDGYTIGFVNLPSMNGIILNPERKATFTLDDFVPIINQVTDPSCMYVKPESPYKTLKDLLDDARKRPREITVTTTGIFSNEHLGILLLEEAAKVEFRIVHLGGSAPITAALLGGQVDVGADNVGGVWISKVMAGQVRPLVLWDTERSRFHPKLPTTGEQGYPTVVMPSSRGIVGPKGIPEPILKKLQTVFRKAIEDPAHMERMNKAGLAVNILVGDEYAKHIKHMHQMTETLMKRQGVAIVK